MEQYIPKSALVAEIKNRLAGISDICQGYIADKKMGAEYALLNELLDFIDTLEVKEVQEEPVSEDLEEASMAFAKHFGDWHYAIPCFQDGANWQKENLWKPADGDDLPEIDREVIAFQETFPTDVDAPSLFKIVIAHRPNPKGYDGKSIATGKVEHYTPKTYDKGGWNIPNVVLWLDLNIPNLEED